MTQTSWSVDFANPVGEPGLCGPESVHWRVYRNPIALTIGGVSAVLLEFADARIRSGVWDHSTYRVDPIGRSKRTAMAALVGVYGPASAARRVIEGVNRMHARVQGATPDGTPYRALDPELLDWVSATAVWGFLEASHGFVAPVSDDDRATYFRESGPVARLYGVQQTLSCDADFFTMLERLAPRFEPHAITGEFLDIIATGKATPNVPRRLTRSLARASVSLLPPLVRERLELGIEWQISTADRLALRAMAKVAELLPASDSPALQAPLRYGLPSTYCFKSRAAQKRLLALAGLTTAAT